MVQSYRHLILPYSQVSSIIVPVPEGVSGSAKLGVVYVVEGRGSQRLFHFVSSRGESHPEQMKSLWFLALWAVNKLVWNIA